MCLVLWQYPFNQMESDDVYDGRLYVYLNTYLNNGLGVSLAFNIRQTTISVYIRPLDRLH